MGTGSVEQTDGSRGAADDLLGADSCTSQLAYAGVAAGLAQLFSAVVHNQWMMQDLRRNRPAERPRELDLTPGRRQQVGSANDQVDAVQHVVDSHRKLIRP